MPLLAKLRAFVNTLNNEPASDVPEKMNKEKKNLGLEGMATAKEVASSDLR